MAMKVDVLMRLERMAGEEERMNLRKQIMSALCEED